MAEIKVQYPFIDENGNKQDSLIKYYAEDKDGNRYYIKQSKTGIEFIEAVDIYPSKQTYIPTDIKVD